MKTSVVSRRAGGLGWMVAFVALLALECAPVWTLPHFPSQDGPSHLYNASLLANWNSQPLYREYYELRLTPAGNLLFQVLLAAMIKVIPIRLIEPLLLTSYIAFFSLAFLLLLQRIGPNAWAFACFAFIFAANNFFQTGFWNFMFSIPLALAALLYYLRGRARATPGWLVALTLLGLLVYEMHMASWLVLALALGLFSASEALELRRKRSGTAMRALLPLFTLLPPLVLTAIFMAGAGYRSVSAERIPESLVDRVKPLAALSFLRSLSDADLMFTGAFGLLVIGMTMLALWRRSRTQPSFQSADMWLAVAIACGAASVLAPGGASGVFIRHRLAFYAWMFAVVWLSAQAWRPAFLRGCAAAVCLLAALPFFWRIPEYLRWERRIEEFQTAGPAIRPGTTVLALDMQRTWHRINPLLHAVDLFTPRPFVDLRNYEAATAYFPTAFRPGRNPFDSLGTLDELQHMPPIFHLSRYQQETQLKVDYLLFYGDSGGDPKEQTLYARQLRCYQLIYRSRPTGIARLYRRLTQSPGCSPAGAAEQDVPHRAQRRQFRHGQSEIAGD